MSEVVKEFNELQGEAIRRAHDSDAQKKNYIWYHEIHHIYYLHVDGESCFSIRKGVQKFHYILLEKNTQVSY